MIKQGIRISWYSSQEFIELDFAQLSQNTQITTTREWWIDDEQLVTYNVVSECSQSSDGVVTLVIRYDHKLNPHLDRSCVYWGTSTIVINPDATSGKASWSDASVSAHNGDTEWEKIGDLLAGQRRRVTTTKIMRQQQQFRQDLIALGIANGQKPKCELTGETEQSALEAAHIVAVKNDGNEVVQNGLLLRADIHRLYDAGAFTINIKGEVSIISDQLSTTYRKLLSGKVLSPEVLDRVQDALIHVEQS